MNRFLVLAIGNTLLSDDGAGAFALRRLQQGPKLPPDVRLVDGGTLSFSLAAELDDCDGLIVVDASRFGAKPGSLRCFSGIEMDAQLQRRGRSVHEVGLSDVLDMARLTGALPARRALIGIEPAVVDWGETLSPEVAAALPEATARVLELLHEWRGAVAASPGDARTPVSGFAS